MKNFPRITGTGVLSVVLSFCAVQSALEAPLNSAEAKSDSVTLTASV